ncbi:MAG: RidA family protein [Candidatus Eisenbacteria bacterium]|uniref:RidA family protein n=1 Tax=Eiseniibacteriota bacterium TaxID=2212470 RepID=A0A956RS70_UNCEI|nr:RidA family protein [Candidatus Eisenbacteria bacterium]
MNEAKRIATKSAPEAIGPYSQALADPISGFLFCSGQIGLDPATGSLVEGGVESEFRRVLENVRAVLDAGGCQPADVLKTTLFLVDMSDFARVNAIYGEFFDEPFPARSTVAVAALPKGARVELEVTARRR